MVVIGDVDYQNQKPLNTSDLEGARQVLKTVFGYDSFKVGQESVVNTILTGGDVLTVMPTGAGKSVCYQIPALLLGGITIVVSPLISLMQDQVKALNAVGVHSAYINSSLSDNQIKTVFKNAKSGAYKIIYVAPERLESRDFLAFSKDVDISMVTVDEAHCISQWGQDFRPSYLKIINYIRQLTKRPIISAFTATATQEVREDIIATLNLENPKIVISGYNRENLYFAVEVGVDKEEYIVDYIENHSNDSGIIYCSTRKNVDKIFEMLHEKGFSVTRYHAGMTNEERKINQDEFIYDNISIMVATNAFGMGIDKSNVRFVLHYNMPQSMENYYQEAGRAGRDGLRSECILLFSPQDVLTQKWLLDHKTFEDIPSEIIESIKDRDIRRLHVMENYCKTTECLRNYILNYFGENTTEDCFDCGNCSREYKKIDMTQEAKCVANCVFETKGRYGLSLVVGTLIGANRARIREVGADNYKTYGALSAVGKPMVKRLIAQMISDGYLIKTDNEYSVIRFGDQIEKLKSPETHVFVRYFEEKKRRRRKTAERVCSTDALTRTGYELFDRLKKLRMKIAKEEAMPAYIVFSDRTLLQMCLILPQSKDEMLVVSGVGLAKYERYGERFIDCIKDFIAHNGKAVSNDDIAQSGEITLKENRRVRKNGGEISKSDFFLEKEEAEKFEYEDYIDIEVLRKRLNEIRDKSRSRVVRNMHIEAYLSDMGYASEKYIDGHRVFIISEEGKKLGLQFIKQQDWRGREVQSVLISRKVQEMIVNHYTVY